MGYNDEASVLWQNYTSACELSRDFFISFFHSSNAGDVSADFHPNARLQQRAAPSAATGVRRRHTSRGCLVKTISVRTSFLPRREAAALQPSWLLALNIMPCHRCARYSAKLIIACEKPMPPVCEHCLATTASEGAFVEPTRPCPPIALIDHTTRSQAQFPEISSA